MGVESGACDKELLNGFVVYVTNDATVSRKYAERIRDTGEVVPLVYHTVAAAQLGQLFDISVRCLIGIGPRDFEALRREHIKNQMGDAARGRTHD